MESNKEAQHFVPKFYLKKFSNNNDERSIGLYIKNQSKLVKCASIAGQSQKPYYYGEDGKIENLLMQIETPASRVFNRICETVALVKKPIDDYFRILHFTINLYFRNPIQSEILLVSDKGFNNHFEKYKSNPEIKKHLDNKLTTAQSILFSLTQSPRISRMCLDLSSKLIVNKTEIPFITSDNPVIKYNMFSDQFKNISAGFTSHGLQIFLPLTPSLILMFYDPKAYLINEGDSILINDIIEVEQLNILQVLNCHNCLYFNQNTSDLYIQSLLVKSSKYSKPNEIIPIKFGSYFLQSISELKTNLNLESVQLLPDQPPAPNGQMILPMRDHAVRMRIIFEKETNERENKVSD